MVDPSELTTVPGSTAEAFDGLRDCLCADLLANIIFAQRFRDTSDSANAFAANLIGAMVGGVLEYSSLIIGYRNLLIVALLLYIAAGYSGRRHFRPAI